MSSIAGPSLRPHAPYVTAETAGDSEAPAQQKQSKSVTFETVQTSFWHGIESNNVERVARQLGKLGPTDRTRLANTPKHVTEFEPKLPLCVAAASGAVPVMRALLQPGAAYPMAGEVSEDLVLTALYWAAAYGCGDAMNLLHDEFGVPSAQVLVACQESATEQLVTWLRARDVSGSDFDAAMQAAVERDDMASIKSLSRFGAARVDICMPETDDAKISLLCFAIRENKLAAANALLDAGVNANGYAEDAHALNAQRALWLAIQGHHVALTKRLRKAGATADFEHLKLALGQGNASTALYIALLDGGVEPQSASEAADLQRLAIASNNLELTGLVTAQKTLLERKGTLAVTSSKGKEKDTVYTNALAHVMQLRESLRHNPKSEVTLPAGIAMLTTAARPREVRLHGLAKLSNKFRNRKAAPQAAVEEQALELANRRHR